MRPPVFLPVVFVSLAVSVPALAADVNSYRAGEAYLKSPAQSYTQCEAQCRGDAACRGWNFVRPNMKTRSGICEFNARFASPIASPISISGEIHTEVDSMLSRAVPARGHIVRVGTPVMPKPETRRIVRREKLLAPKPVVRANVQKRIPAKPNMTGPAAKPVDPRQPRIYGGPVQKMTAAAREKAVTRLTRQQVYQRQLLAAQRRTAAGMDMRARPLNATAASPVARPTIRQPQAPASRQRPYGRAQYGQAQYGQPRYAQPPRQPINTVAQRVHPPQAGQQVPVRGGQVPSLYGALNDDLTTGMTPVPRPRSVPDNPADPDAPLSTVHPAPVAPVNTAPIVPTGLAGG